MQPRGGSAQRGIGQFGETFSSVHFFLQCASGRHSPVGAPKASTTAIGARGGHAQRASHIIGHTGYGSSQVRSHIDAHSRQTRSPPHVGRSAVINVTSSDHGPMRRPVVGETAATLNVCFEPGRSGAVSFGGTPSSVYTVVSSLICRPLSIDSMNSFASLDSPGRLMKRHSTDSDDDVADASEIA